MPFPKNQETKRVIYRSAATLFGLLLGFAVGMWVELAFVSWKNYGEQTTAFWSLANPYTLVTLWCMGIGALWSYRRSRAWWQYIYVDKKWAGLYRYVLNRCKCC